MKVIIAGGREFDDYKLLKDKCNFFLKDSEDITIVCGKARGADTLGEQYGKENNFKIDYFIPDWDNLGKKAGFIRNHQMGDHADVLIAFWDGKSRGTYDMISYMKKLGKPYRVVRYQKIDDCNEMTKETFWNTFRSLKENGSNILIRHTKGNITVRKDWKTTVRDDEKFITVFVDRKAIRKIYYKNILKVEKC